MFLGRFTAALRVMIPGLAGMARMHYRTFLLYNVAGGAAWATGMVLLGYLAGASWQQAAHWASRIGLALLALIVLGLALRLAARATRRRADRLRAVGDRVAATAPVGWVRRRFPTQLGWLRRRVDPLRPQHNGQLLFRCHAGLPPVGTSPACRWVVMLVCCRA